MGYSSSRAKRVSSSHVPQLGIFPFHPSVLASLELSVEVSHGLSLLLGQQGPAPYAWAAEAFEEHGHISPEQSGPPQYVCIALHTLGSVTAIRGVACCVDLH